MRRGALRRGAPALAVGLAVAGLALAAYELDAFRSAELATVDTRFAIRGRQTPPRDLVIVAVDDETITHLARRWPFPRSLDAQVIRRISKDTPQVLAFDVLFDVPTAPRQDEALADSIAAAGGKIVLAATAVGPAGPNVFSGNAVLRQLHARAGYTGLPNDPGVVLRRVPYSVRGLRSFAIVAAEVALGHSIEPLTLRGKSAWIDYYGPPGTIAMVPFWRVLDGEVKPGFFAGKVVVVGVTSPTAGDLHATATSANEPMSGAEIEANAIASAIRGFPLRDAPAPVTPALVVLFGLSVPLLALRVRLAVALPLALATAALFAAATQLAFNAGVIVPFVYPLVALVLSAVAALAVRYGMAIVETRSIRLAKAGEFAVGVEVGGYKIERTLGRGGAGTVYLATDATLRRRVALKVLNPELADDPVFRKRFLHESQVAAALDHPNVVPIYRAGEEGGRLFLAMKFVPGSLLALLRRDRTLGAPRALAIAEQVGDALDSAHRLGLVHRDVTPSNVLLEPPTSPDAFDRAYLTDFGLVVEGGASAGELAGKPEYLAPEQIRGERVDGRADVYSLGCVLFECLVGEPPFTGSSELAVIRGHLSGKPPNLVARRPDLPSTLDSVFERALAKDVELRFETCAAFVTAVRTAARTGPGQPASAPV